MSTIGERIREARIALGMTQEELALRAGYSGRSAINKIEVGKSVPGQKYLIEISKALDVSPSWLLGTDEKANALEDAFNRRPEMRILFDVAEDCTAEEIQKVIDLIETLKNK